MGVTLGTHRHVTSDVTALPVKSRELHLETRLKWNQAS